MSTIVRLGIVAGFLFIAAVWYFGLLKISPNVAENILLNKFALEATSRTSAATIVVSSTVATSTESTTSEAVIEQSTQ